MKDIEKLLKMTERPQDYSDEEIRQLMNDPDMRAYYELMVDAEAGFALKKQNHEISSKKNHGERPMILRIAAMFIGVLLISGICFAAYRLVVGGEMNTQSQEVELSNAPQQVGSPQQELTETNAVRTFENAELQQILQELSDYYHVGVEFRNDQSRHIRLYTKWDTTAPLDQMITLLNGFEKVSIHLIDNRIVAE
jgi:hypothetical protein